MDAAAVGRRHAGVIRLGELLRLQGLRLFLGGLPRRGVDDGGPASRVGEHAQQGRRTQGRRDFHEFDFEVVPPESVNRPLAVDEIQLRHDVVLHQGRGGGGESDDGCRSQGRDALAQAPVLGAEIVPPHGDAMRLVNRHEARRAAGEKFRESRHREAFRRDV